MHSESSEISSIDLQFRAPAKKGIGQDSNHGAVCVFLSRKRDALDQTKRNSRLGQSDMFEAVQGGAEHR